MKNKIAYLAFFFVLVIALYSCIAPTPVSEMGLQALSEEVMEAGEERGGRDGGDAFIGFLREGDSVVVYSEVHNIGLSFEDLTGVRDPYLWVDDINLSALEEVCGCVPAGDPRYHLRDGIFYILTDKNVMLGFGGSGLKPIFIEKARLLLRQIRELE